MFGIGMTELMVIFVLALLVLGPKRLPDLARSLGRGLAEFRRASTDIRREFMDVADEVRVDPDDLAIAEPEPPRRASEAPPAGVATRAGDAPAAPEAPGDAQETPPDPATPRDG